MTEIYHAKFHAWRIFGFATFHAQHKGLLQDWEYQYIPPMFMADPDNRAQAELLHNPPFDSCDDFFVGDQWYFWAEGL